jgi:hypothetical protein
MTTEYQLTREEEAYERLLDEKGEMLSEPARTVLGEATRAAYKECMVRSYCFQPQEYEEAMEKMRLAATEFTSQDRELLAELVHAAKAAYASIDPKDRTPIGHKVNRGDVHWYYRMVSAMVEEILQGETIRQNLETLWDRFVLAIKGLRMLVPRSVRWRSNWRKRDRETGQT